MFLKAFSLASCVASFASAPIIVLFAPDGGLAAKLGLAGLMCGVCSPRVSHSLLLT